MIICIESIWDLNEFVELHRKRVDPCVRECVHIYVQWLLVVRHVAPGVLTIWCGPAVVVDGWLCQEKRHGLLCLAYIGASKNTGALAIRR